MSKMFFLSTTFNKGGASHCAIEIYNELKDRNEMSLFNLVSQASFSSSEVSETVITLSSAMHGSKIRRLITYLISFLRYVGFLYSKSPQISMSINIPSHVVNILACKITSVKPVIAVHDMPTYYTSTLEKMMKSIPLYLSKLFHCPIIAVSNGIREVLITKYSISENAIVVIYNPVDIKKITEMALDWVEEELFSINVPIIISVGNVVPVKGQWHILRTFVKIREIMDCKLIICGDTNIDKKSLSYLYQILAQMKYKDDVIFTGYVANPYKYLKHADVFVLSSLSEGLPYVLIESMACGCPIVAADCSPGIEEILGSDCSCGFIVNKMSGVHHTADDPLDEGELSLFTNIRRILEDDDLRSQMSVACQERAKMFDLDIGIHKYVEVFEGVCSPSLKG